MDRKEWLEKELKKEYERKRLVLKQKARKEAKNLKKILKDAKINKGMAKNVVMCFEMLRRCGDVDQSAHVSVAVAVAVAMDCFLYGIDKEIRERLSPEKIHKLL